MISSLYQISDSGKTESTLRATRKTPPEPVGPGGALWERESVGSADDDGHRAPVLRPRSEEHTSELQSLMRTSHAVFCLNKKHISKQKQMYPQDTCLQYNY